MKSGYMLTIRSNPSRDSAVDPQGGPNCKGRYYLPRICSQGHLYPTDEGDRLDSCFKKPRPENGFWNKRTHFYSVKLGKRTQTNPFLTRTRWGKLSQVRSSPVKVSIKEISRALSVIQANPSKSKVNFKLQQVGCGTSLSCSTEGVTKP